MGEFFSFDDSRVWDGLNKSVLLSPKQRAFLRLATANIYHNREQFIINTTDSEALEDWLNKLQADLQNTMIISPEVGFQERYYFDGTFLDNGLGTSVIIGSQWAAGSRTSYSPTTGASTNRVYFPNVAIKAGNYKFDMLYVANTGCGIWNIRLHDGSGNYKNIGLNQDLYLSSAGTHTRWTTLSFTVNADVSNWILEFQSNGKRTAAVNYHLNLVCASINKV